MTRSPDIQETIHQLNQARQAACQPDADFDAIQMFGILVERLGYVEDAAFNWRELVEEAIFYYNAYLASVPDDGVVMNNVGVLLLNSGNPVSARKYFLRALDQLPWDETVHRNVRISDMLMMVEEAAWHTIPENTAPGRHTLLAFFKANG